VGGDLKTAFFQTGKIFREYNLGGEGCPLFVGQTLEVLCYGGWGGGCCGCFSEGGRTKSIPEKWAGEREVERAQKKTRRRDGAPIAKVRGGEGKLLFRVRSRSQRRGVTTRGGETDPDDRPNGIPKAPRDSKTPFLGNAGKKEETEGHSIIGERYEKKKNRTQKQNKWTKEEENTY